MEDSLRNAIGEKGVALVDLALKIASSLSKREGLVESSDQQDQN